VIYWGTWSSPFTIETLAGKRGRDNYLVNEICSLIIVPNIFQGYAMFIYEPGDSIINLILVYFVCFVSSLYSSSSFVFVWVICRGTWASPFLSRPIATKVGETNTSQTR
jgi:hypothetical protein